jgi:hypothetical protein
MISRYRLVTFVLLLMLSLGGVSGVIAQTTDTSTETDELQNDITTVNAAAELDQTALLIRLSAQFQVELAVLENLSAQGYTAGQIWLALEISQQTGAGLAVSIAQAASIGGDGHGWGVLAQALGISPGSPEFLALKAQMRNRTRTMASDIAKEHGKDPDNSDRGSAEKDNSKGNGGQNGKH